MAINEADIAIAEQIAELAMQLGPEVATAIEAAIKNTRPELVADDLPGSDADALKAQADAEIAAKFPAKT